MNDQEKTPPRGTAHDFASKSSTEIVESAEMRAFRKIIVDVTNDLRDDLASRLEKATAKLAPRWVVYAVVALAIVQLATIAFLWYSLGR